MYMDGVIRWWSFNWNGIMWYHFNLFYSALYALILRTATFWFPTGVVEKQGKNAPGAGPLPHLLVM
jgi:hypothetical protein